MNLLPVPRVLELSGETVAARPAAHRQVGMVADDAGGERAVTEPHQLGQCRLAVEVARVVRGGQVHAVAVDSQLVALCRE